MKDLDYSDGHVGIKWDALCELRRLLINSSFEAYKDEEKLMLK
jgi:hypothetical protein